MKTILPLALTALVLAVQLASSGCLATPVTAPAVKASLVSAFPIAEAQFARGQRVAPSIAGG